MCLSHIQQYFSYIVVVSFIGGGNQRTRRKPPTCRKSLTTLDHIMLYRVHLAWVGFEPTTLVVIGTDCIGSNKSNYHTITTTMSPIAWKKQISLLLLSCRRKVSKCQNCNQKPLIEGQAIQWPTVKTQNDK